MIDFWAVTLLFLLVLFAGTLLFLEMGRRVGLRRAKDAEGGGAGFGAVEGAVFGLLGLLIAFTFSGAASRFDARRQLVGEEANDIGTAYLRIDLLPAEKQPAMRDLFRQYLDARLEVYQKIPDMAAVKAAMAKAEGLQKVIWTDAVAASQASNTTTASMLLLPAVNAMIDITTTRTVAMQTHPPVIIFGMLGVLALACALLAGFGMAGQKKRSWLHMLGFAAILTFSVYVILDLEFPRLGFIEVTGADQVLIDLRRSMD
jgi:hypothetical protein